MKQKGAKRSGKRSSYRPFIAAALVLLFTASLLAYFPTLFNPDKTPPTNSTKPDSTGPKITPIILNKQIPPGYVMGFPVEAGLDGINAVFLSTANQSVSDRFTSKFSGEVGSIVIYGQAYQGKPRVTVGLQADNLGSPSGAWLATNGFATIPLNSTLKFIKVRLSSPVNLEQGKVYHIVIEPSEGYNGTAAVMNFKRDAQGQPYNGGDPDLVWPDASVNTLLFDKGSWVAQDRWPIFVVLFTDGRSEGQPYSLEAPWVVFGSTYVGQTVIPASDYNVGKVAFVLSIKGQPKDRLYYRVLDSANNVLSSGVFAEPSQLDANQKWIEVPLSSPVQLKAGQLNRIVVYSPGTDLSNCYMLYGYEFCYDSSIGYGGLQHQLTTSLDGGKIWGEWTDADAVFKLTTAA